MTGGVQSVRTELEELERSGALQGTPSEWGPRIWRVLEKTVRIIPCNTCRAEGVTMIDGLHDVVNVHKGDRAERPKALCELAAQAAHAAATSKSCPMQIRERRVYG